MKIAVFSTHDYDKVYFEKHNTGHELSFFAFPLNEQTVSATKGFDAICIFVNDTVNEAVLDALHQNNVKLIALRCAGFNNVAITYATSLNIPTVRVPQYAPEAVAEHALALILTLNRKTHKAYNRIREGNFSLEGLMGFNLYQKTVAVIGTGKIGKSFCCMMRGLGCKVKAYDIVEDEELKALGVTYHSFEDTIADADIVSLHCPLMDSTRHLINTKSLEYFKHGAMLINTSRGGLIETCDALEALKTGKLGYLGLDVYEQEANLFFHDHSEDIIQDDLIMRLIGFPNVIITSHQGFFTQEAMTEIATTTYENIDAFVKNEPLINRI
ncbi:2-hydroxyacid dehydrogenase [Mucilaginibacter agri]|uniref:2-hydroxyacid dehydrogenase n=1 Tax=Mucilaginibacter agri TaxID=2695265 RepID=A0A966DQL1_9SPHI|nr:2-hydroxyacid dehydrogenase [Mucilaginibacter agri]NCD68108.1 2-hydroxyacid dehydrogenase [Mucilaginibacter agri]